jgi:hypothetical protein
VIGTAEAAELEGAEGAEIFYTEIAKKLKEHVE